MSETVTVDGQEYIFPPENPEESQEDNEIIWPPQGEAEQRLSARDRNVKKKYRSNVNDTAALRAGKKPRTPHPSR